MSDPTALIEAYLDEELRSEEEQELLDWLASDPEHQRAFVRETHLHHELRSALLCRQTLAELGARSPQEFLEQPSLSPQVAKPRKLLRFGELVRLFVRPGWATLACLLCVGALVFAAWRLGWAAPAPVLFPTGAGVELVRNHNAKPVTGRLSLHWGDEVRTGSAGSARLQYSEGTQIDLDPDTATMVTQTNGIRWIQVSQGTLYATVAHQKSGLGLVFVSPQGEARVLGTMLKFLTHDGQTELEVYSGKVRFASLRRNAQLEVVAGSAATADANGVLEARPIPPSQGKILWEYWKSVKGTEVRDLTADPRFPDRPDGQVLLDAFEQPSNWGDYFGTRVRGFLHAPRTGDYVFWIAADDTGELWLSPTENPARRERICWTTEYTLSREWEKHPQQKARSIHLVGGRKYYVEALMKEGGGADCLAVAWEGPAILREVIPGKFLSPPPPDATPTPPAGRIP